MSAISLKIKIGNNFRPELSRLSIVHLSLIIITGVILSLGNEWPLVGFFGLLGDWAFALHMYFQEATDGLFTEYWVLCYNYKVTIVKTVFGIINLSMILSYVFLKKSWAMVVSNLGTVIWIIVSIFHICMMYGA